MQKTCHTFTDDFDIFTDLSTSYAHRLTALRLIPFDLCTSYAHLPNFPTESYAQVMHICRIFRPIPADSRRFLQLGRHFGPERRLLTAALRPAAVGLTPEKMPPRK
jgi:hypothetical protein